jgi:acyl-CoA synthetase (AMP-forming)/AMP-acid ligase II
MILGEINRASGIATTLDDLFRRAGVRHPDSPALVDPPNRQTFTDGAPRGLTYAQADHAISAVAARLRSFGLPTDAVVAMQLPNTIDSIVAFLGILRAGMIAAPVPLLWCRRDMVDALGRIGAKAIVTCARGGGLAHAEIAMHTAAALFPIRHICGFGRDLPDGIVSLDDVFAPARADLSSAPVRPDTAAAHVAAITFGVDARGTIPMARNHIELVSGGLAVVLEGGIGSDACLLSTVPIGSFAGLALTLMPWLLSGGTLHLHHGFEPLTFCAQRDVTDFDAITLPAAALPAMAAAGLLDGEACTLVALWRAPEQMMDAKSTDRAPTLVDVSSFGETGIVAARRNANGPPLPIPHGAISVPRGAIGAMTVIETARSGSGTLLLRGPMVPAAAFPRNADTPRLSPDGAGYFDTGYACRLDASSQTLAITVPPPNIVSIGGYRMRHNDLDACLEKAAPDATVVALPDRTLGQRLAGTAQDNKTVAAALEAQGANALISGAFRQRGGADAA